MRPRRAPELPTRFPPRVAALLRSYGVDLSDPAFAAAFREGVRVADEAARAFGYMAPGVDKVKVKARRKGG